MIYTILGVALIAAGVGSFWYLLPRHCQIHPMVDNADGGSMITIGIMTILTAGVGFLMAGLFS